MPSRHALSLAAMMLLPTQAHAAETLWTEVIVRVYDATGASAAERRAALDAAASIVSAASVELIWRTCEGARNSGPCAAPLAPRELALRLVRSRTGSTTGGDLPLGDALIDTAAGSGVLATIYVDRVERMAAENRVNRDALLGRAIAHELGHLLMATSTHSVSGLMRSVWSQSEIRRGEKRDWTFAPRELAAIKARTLSKADALVSLLRVP